MIKTNKNGWQLDKHINIAVIIATLVQTVSIVWYASKLDSRVDALEQWRQDINTNTERLIRIEERLAVMSEKLHEIKSR